MSNSTDPDDLPRSPRDSRSDDSEKNRSPDAQEAAGQSLDSHMASRIMSWVDDSENDGQAEDHFADDSYHDDRWQADDWGAGDGQETLDSIPTHNAVSTIDEMVVYLDGQLNDEDRKELEKKLLVDEEARQHLADLQKSWDALDALPRSECSHSFTESTVKLVVKDALRAKTKTNRWRLPLQLALGSLLAFVSLGAGFVVARQWMTFEDRQLLQELDLIENWEKYEAVGDLPFLKRLEQEELFTQGSNRSDE